MSNATKPDCSCSPEAPRVTWARLCFAFLLPALATKFAMILVDLRDAAHVEWTVQLVGRGVLFLWGRDLWVSFALGLLCFGVVRMAACLPARAYVFVRAGVDFAVLMHAVFCALAFAYFVEEGDFVTCQLADLVEMQGEHTGLWGSMLSTLSIGAVAMLALCMGLALVGCRCVGVRVWRWSRRARVALVALLIFEALFAVLAVPALVRGDMPVRFKSHGLERSPLLRLASSCMEDQLESALASSHAHARDPGYGLPDSEAQAQAPWGGATRRTNVVVLVLESAMDPVAFGETHAVPYTSALLSRPDVVHLDEHYATYALTTKSTFSILMGEYPDPHYASVVGRKPGLALEGLPERLHGAGYATWFASSQDLSFDRQRAFYARHGFERIVDKHELGGPEVWGTDWGIDDAVTIDQGFTWIDGHLAAEPAQPSPFLLVIQTFAAHHPYEVPPSSGLSPLPEGATRQQKYERALLHLDGVVRRVVEGIEARGLTQDTLLLVVSDHGEGWGPNKGRNVAEANIRPLAFFKGPQFVANSGDVNEVEVSSHVDLAPTVLGALGLDLPCTMQGRDLRAGAQPKVVVFAGRPPKSQRGLRDGKWKFVSEHEQQWLFDLSVDPEATRDLSRAHPRRSARYAHLLDDWDVNSKWRFEHAARVRAGCAVSKG